MKNIIWLASYPKSGNTWFRMFIANFLQNSNTPLPLEDIEKTRIASNPVDFEEEIGLNPFELRTDEMKLYMPILFRSISDNANRDSGFLFKKIHDAFIYNSNGSPVIPDEISKGVIYFVRNPLDVAVSYANHSAHEMSLMVKRLVDESNRIGGRKSGQLSQTLLSWSSHVKSWTTQKLIPVHLVRYEDMISKPMETFGGTLKFLGIDYDNERLARAIRHSDFKQLKGMELENGFSERLQQCNSFFWKGTIGNYKEHLNQEQITSITEHCREVMMRYEYLDQNGILTV